MSRFLPYARQVIDEADVSSVTSALQSDWLTTGPWVEAFEQALAKRVGAKHAIVCNSGTAALYMASRAAGLKPGDKVIVPSVTFLATASANVLAGIEVVFSDVDPDSGLMKIEHAQQALDRGGQGVRAIFPVHLGGRVQTPESIHSLAEQRNLIVLEDACHALGTRYGNAQHQIGCAPIAWRRAFHFTQQRPSQWAKVAL